MISTIGLVRQFHEKFGVEIKPKPDLSDADLCALRYALLQEELTELKHAMVAGDIVETLDALTDLQVVLDGAFLCLGFWRYKDAAFQEVHRSNMSKLDSSGNPILREDGKILKGPHYTPPDLTSILDGRYGKVTHK